MKTNMLAGLKQPVSSWIRIVFYVSATTAVFIYSMTSSFGSIRTFYRETRMNDDVQYHAGLWFAPKFLDRLNDDTLTYLGSLQSLATVQHTGGDHEASNDICPVILSPIPRLDPHWLWLVTSLLKNSQKSDSALRMSSILLITRSTGTKGLLRYPFRETFLNNLLNKGIVNLKVVKHDSTMPSRHALLHKLDEATEKQTEHFILQLFDHAAAWEDCRHRKCRYCLVLEDDVIMSHNWQRRLTEAIDQLHKDDPEWGYIKLFEVDDFWKASKGWQPTIYDLVSLLFLSYLGSLAITLIFNRDISVRSSSTPMFIWVLILLIFLGRDVVIPPTILSGRPRFSEPTSTRAAKYPERGAVGNVYRYSDLQNLTAAAFTTVDRSMTYAVQYYGRNLSLIEPEEEREKIIRFRHSDRIRADVFVSEYFRGQERSISIVEPNLVQHIGFRSTEPSAGRLRTAMTNSFEDGRLF